MAHQRHIQKQFDALEAQKKATIEAASPGNESSDYDKLVPDTPSPRKKRRTDDDRFRSGQPSRESLARKQNRECAVNAFISPKEQPIESNLPPERQTAESNLLNRMSNVGRDKHKVGQPSRRRPHRQPLMETEEMLESLRRDQDPANVNRQAPAKFSTKVARTSKREPHRSDERSEDISEDELEVTDRPVQTRHKDGTVIVELVVGPHEFRAPEGDPNFEKYEPYSGIHLKPGSRETSHGDLQDFMDQRAALSPALVYSLARGAQQKAHSIDLACENEFVVFGVLAWKDEVRFTRADALRDDSNKPRKPWEMTDDANEEDKDDMFKALTKRQKQKKYIRFEMIDLSTPEASQAGTGRLNLLLFEADIEETIKEEDGYQRKTYSGGSYGLFEKIWKVPPGTVVAVLGPRISKYQPPPGQASENILTLTPERDAEIQIIGRARDWGTCQAFKRDGKPCTSWRDLRAKSPYCSYHKTLQVKRVGARRAETFSAQSNAHQVVSYSAAKFNASVKAGHKKTINPDPNRVTPATKFGAATKTGLLPRINVQLHAGERTYCVAPHWQGKHVASAHVALRAAAIESGNSSGGYIQGFRDGPTVAEAERKLAEEKKGAERRRKERDNLLALDRGTTVGGAYLLVRSSKEKASDSEEESSKKRRPDADRQAGDENDDSADGAAQRKKSEPFSGSAIMKIGFDPTAKGGKVRDESAQSRKVRMDAIDSLSSRGMQSEPKQLTRPIRTAPNRSQAAAE